jgi:hypothetical protein
MHIEEDETRTYSHTSLALWRLCKRRWFNRYILKKKELPFIPAAWSVHMVHKPIQLSIHNKFVFLGEKEWQACFDAFKLEIGDPNFEDHIHAVGTGKRILAAIRQTSPGLSGCLAEQEARIRFSTLTSYSSRPDLIGVRDGRRFTVDFKYTERAWKTVKAPWPIRPLLPYDDQLLGQAILSEADGFMRGTIAVEPKTGQISGPIYEEKLVDGQLRKEWLAETKATIEEIEGWLWNYEWQGAHHEPTSWPKNSASCLAFGKECPYTKDCKGGWNSAKRAGE